MSIIGAFIPMGKTYKANATTSSQVITVTADAPCNQYMFTNHENANTGLPVYVRISTDSGVTITTPANGAAQYAIPIPQDTTVVITGPQVSSTSNVYIAFRSESGTPECYVTPGEGR